MTITKTHDELWAHTLENWREFHKIMLDEADSYDFWLAMYENRQHLWTLIFGCPIKSQLNPNCRLASEFLHIVNNCLDHEYFVGFIISNQLLVSYIRPLLHHVAITYFAHQVPIDQWDKQSKLAFQVVMRLVTPNADRPIDGNEPDRQRMHELMTTLLGNFGHEFGEQRSFYLSQLSRALDQFEWSFDATFDYKELHAGQPEPVEPCKCRAPEDFPVWVGGIRQVLCEGILYGPEPLGRLFSIVKRTLCNMCDIGNLPNKTSQMHALMGERTFGSRTMKHLSNEVFHDEQFVKSWARTFLPYALQENCTLLFHVLGDLTGRPRYRRGMQNRDDPHWAPFLERSHWVVEVYCELYPKDRAGGVMHLLEGPVSNYRVYAPQAGARLLALLQLHKILSEEQHMSIIERVIANENPREPEVKVKSWREDTVASYLLTLEDESCTNLLIMIPPDGFTSCYFSQAAWNATILRYVTPEAPDHLFKSAIEATNVFQQDMLWAEVRRQKLYPVTRTSLRQRPNRLWYESMISPYNDDNVGRNELRLSFIDRLLVVLDAGKHQDLVLAQLEDVASVYLISKLSKGGRHFTLSYDEEIVVEALDRSQMKLRGKPFPKSVIHFCHPSRSRSRRRMASLRNHSDMPPEKVRRFDRRSYLREVLKMF